MRARRALPERMLARDLRFRLCGNATECEGLNPDVWKVGNFWPAMMHGHTTKGAQTPSMHDLFRSQTQVEDPAWSKQWLSCTNNGSGVDCQGLIARGVCHQTY